MRQIIKTFASLSLMVAALMVTWGCSSSDDDDENDNDPKTQLGYVMSALENAPDWKIDWSSNDPAPNWESPDPTNFESWAVLMVKLDSDISEYATENDMMAVFVDDELCATSLSSKNLSGQIREDDGSVYFILKIFRNSFSGGTVNFTLKYYSNTLHQMFTLEGQEKFVAERVYGVNEDFEPKFTSGSSKYPVVTELEITTNFTELSGITPSAGDVIGVFVGDECRGLYKLNDAMSAAEIKFLAFGRELDETATLKYYSVEKQSVLTFKDTFKLTNGEKSLSINI